MQLMVTKYSIFLFIFITILWVCFCFGTTFIFIFVDCLIFLHLKLYSSTFFFIFTGFNWFSFKLFCAEAKFDVASFFPIINTFLILSTFNFHTFLLTREFSLVLNQFLVIFMWKLSLCYQISSTFICFFPYLGLYSIPLHTCHYVVLFNL